MKLAKGLDLEPKVTVSVGREWTRIEIKVKTRSLAAQGASKIVGPKEARKIYQKIMGKSRPVKNAQEPATD